MSNGEVGGFLEDRTQHLKYYIFECCGTAQTAVCGGSLQDIQTTFIDHKQSLYITRYS